MKKQNIKKCLTFNALIVLITSISSLLFEKCLTIAHLLVHFQLQYFLLLLFFGITLFLLKERNVSLISILYCFILYFILLHPLYILPGRLERTDIFYINVLYDNNNIQPIVDKIKEINPQTITLVESNNALINKLNTFRSQPAINHRAFASSCTTYANEYISAEIEGETHLPLCIVHYDNYDLITVHPHRPLKPSGLRENIAFFDKLSLLITSYEKTNSKFIIVGDFNSTCYSAYFNERLCRYIPKSIYTWMTKSPLTLPLDHVITNMNIDVERTPDLGSDHAGLLIQINE